MAKLLSGRVKTFNVGISSYTESNISLRVIGITSTRSLTVTNSASINGLTYPTSDGSANQIIKTDGSGNLSFGSVSSLTGFDWQADTDLGLITDAVTLTSDSGLITDSVGSSYDLGLIATTGIVYPTQFLLPSFTVSTLPPASPAGQMLFVTDDTGGAVPAFSDGTNWRRVTDRGIIGSEISLTVDYGFIV